MKDDAIVMAQALAYAVRKAREMSEANMADRAIVQRVMLLEGWKEDEVQRSLNIVFDD